MKLDWITSSGKREQKIEISDEYLGSENKSNTESAVKNITYVPPATPSKLGESEDPFESDDTFQNDDTGVFN